MPKFSLKLAQKLTKDGHESEALAHYFGIAKLLPQKAANLKVETFDCISNYLRNATSKEKVFEIIDLAMEVFSGSGDLLNIHGEWLFKNGHVTDAAECFIKAIEIEDSYVVARQNMSNLGTHLFDQWHFRMLNDYIRNEAYNRAIKIVIEEKLSKSSTCSVLDIGSGTGLLSIYAAKAGGTRIFAVEHNKLMCGIGQKVVSDNQIDGVSLINKNSHELTLVDIGDSTMDLVVTELMDAGFFGEGIISALLDAKKRLLSSNGVIIPEKVDIIVALIEAPAIFYEHFHKNLDGDLYASYFCDGNISDEPYTSEFLDEIKGIYRFLTEPFVLWSIDLNSELDLEKYSQGFEMEFYLKIIADGHFHAIVSWFRAELAPGIFLETGPKSGTAWEQAVFPVSQQLFATIGQEIRIDAKISNNWFQCSLPNNSISDEPTLFLDTRSILLLNDHIFIDTFSEWISELNRSHLISRLLYISNQPVMMDILNDSLKSASILAISDKDDKNVALQSYDALICHPVQINGHLAGDILQRVAIMRVQNAILHVIPEIITVRAVLIESPRLMIRSSISSLENRTLGVNLKSALRFFWVDVQEEIEMSHFDYRSLSSHFIIMTMNLRENLHRDRPTLPHFLRQNATVDIETNVDGIMHGLLLYFELSHGLSRFSTWNLDNHFKLCAYVLDGDGIRVFRGGNVQLNCLLDRGHFTFAIVNDV